MDAQRVLEVARSGDAPANWTVWRFREGWARRAALNWALVGLIGCALLIPALIAVVPDGFTGSSARFVFSGLLLIALATVGVGGLALAAYDLWRLAHADDYLLVMTPDDYVKATPRGVEHVPMGVITGVTLKGVKSAREEVERRYAQASRSAAMNLLVMSDERFLRRQPRGQPMLAFRDGRDNREVVVSTDEAFDRLPALEEVLGLYLAAKEKTMREEHKKEQKQV